MDDNYIEAEFSEIDNQEKQEIFSTSEVARRIGETDSALRIWCDKFEDILKIQKSGRNRMFTEENIQELLKIKSLIRDKGYTHDLVIKHYNKTEDEILNELSSPNDPLAIQTISTLIAGELNKGLTTALNGFMEELKQREEVVRKENQEQINELKSTIDKLTDKIDNQIKYTDERELEAKKRYDEVISLLKSKMEQRHKENEDKPKKSFLQRLLGK